HGGPGAGADGIRGSRSACCWGGSRQSLRRSAGGIASGGLNIQRRAENDSEFQRVFSAASFGGVPEFVPKVCRREPPPRFPVYAGGGATAGLARQGVEPGPPRSF